MALNGKVNDDGVIEIKVNGKVYKVSMEDVKDEARKYRERKEKAKLRRMKRKLLLKLASEQGLVDYQPRE